MAEYVIQFEDAAELQAWNNKYASPFMLTQEILIGLKYGSLQEQFEDIFQVKINYLDGGRSEIAGSKNALEEMCNKLDDKTRSIQARE